MICEISFQGKYFSASYDGRYIRFKSKSDEALFYNFYFLNA